MAAGRDTRGIKRGHQFDKVEMVKFVAPETSLDELDARCSPTPRTCCKRPRAALPRGARCAPAICRSRPARSTTSRCGRPAATSGSRSRPARNFGDFQARRAIIRCRTAGKDKPRFVHTLNGSGLALPRTLIAVLETYQHADGTVDVPEVLRPYLGGATVLG